MTQKTGWFILHRIRLSMQGGASQAGKVGREVEIDETHIGGKARSMHYGKRKKATDGTGKKRHP